MNGDGSVRAPHSGGAEPNDLPILDSNPAVAAPSSEYCGYSGIRPGGGGGGGWTGGGGGWGVRFGMNARCECVRG